MAYDYTQQPEYLGPSTAVTYDSSGLRFPEGVSPASEIPGQDYGSPGMPVIGAIEPLLPPEVRDAENAERERRYALRQQIETAALEAARDAMTAQTLSDRVLADVDAAVEKIVAAEPAGSAS